MSDTPTNPYAQMYAWVWDLLEENEITLPAGVLRRYAESAMDDVQVYWPTLPPYAELVDADRRAYEEVIGLTVAARFRRKHPKQTPTGEIIEFEGANITERYATSPVSALAPLETEWKEAAQKALRRISYIRAVVQARASRFSPWRISGPTRVAVESGNRQSLLESIVRLFSEEAAFAIENEDT